MSTAIEIRALTKTFSSGFAALGNRITTAVDAVDLDIEPGELFFLLGPSGCGKTTLLRMIAGFVEATSGSIRFRASGGRDIDVTHVAPNKRQTGMVFQSYALWPHMTVGSNVAFGLTVQKVPQPERDRRVREALAMVQMESYIDRKPNQLSGGQQQRVALARALVVRPSVLLLDEPLSNLDAKLRTELRSEIRRICKHAGLTTVYVTHDQREALSMADRIALMRGGKLVQTGTPHELYVRPGSRFVAEFLGESNFLIGTVEDVSPDGNVRVSTAAGFATLPSGFHVEPGQRITVAARYEGVVLSSTGPSEGTVEEAVFLGDCAHVATRLPGGERVTSVVSSGSPLPSVGTRVRVALDERAIALLRE
jgi:iron(III) transport system ATP-binding protein